MKYYQKISFAVKLLIICLVVLSSQNKAGYSQHPDDIHWDNSFGDPWTVSTNRYTVSEGKFYLRGWFYGEADNDGVRRIYLFAVWDGSGWTLEGAMDMDTFFIKTGTIRTIAVAGGYIYIGGNFTSHGSKEIQYAAYWNGDSWNSLGEGVNGPVNVLSPTTDGIYAGGEFTEAGGKEANHIALWKGFGWENLETTGGAVGVNNFVYAISGGPAHLFVGGSFSSAGGLSGVNNIAQWNGSDWSSLGSGLNNDVHSIAFLGSDIYASGDFMSTADLTTELNYIGRWDGELWHAMGEGSEFRVRTMYASPSKLYARGLFKKAIQEDLPDESKRVAVWDGTLWSSAGVRVWNDNNTFFQLVGEGENVYTQAFGSHEGKHFYGLGHFNGTTWNGMSNAIGIKGEIPDQNNVGNLHVADDKVYALGMFNRGGDYELFRKAVWDGKKWGALDLDLGLSGFPRSVTSIDDYIYIGGSFEKANGITVNNIIRWDGSNWKNLEDGINGTVQTVYSDGHMVYAGGKFSSSGSKEINGIAGWNGETWSTLGSGISVSSSINDIIRTNNKLYVAGDFDSGLNGTVEARNVAVWNGCEWSALGGGIGTSHRPANAVEVIGNDVYVGGFFSSASGTEVSNIARWDGINWHDVGGGVNGTIHSMVANGSDLYVGGSFSMAGEVKTKGIAKWDGNSWKSLGSGMEYSAAVRTLAPSKDGLYVGGNFEVGGNKLSNNIGLWKDFEYNTPHFENPIQCTETKIIREVSAPGVFDFNSEELITGISIEIISVTGSGEITVERFAETAANLTFENETPNSVVNHRWIIDQSGLSDFEAEITINLEMLHDLTDNYMELSHIYVRESNGEGDFRILETSRSENTLKAIVNSFSEFIVGFVGETVSIDDGSLDINTFALHQNYPNPFNPSTVIGYQLPATSDVRLEVFDMLGRRIAVLVDELKPAGVYQAEFDASHLPSGVYIYRIQVNDSGNAGTGMFQHTRKLTLVK